MAMPNHRGAYKDCYEAYDRALADPKGIRMFFGDYGQARAYQNRLHYSRQVLREYHKSVFPKDDPKWGLTEYDMLKVALRQDIEGDWWVYIVPQVLPTEIQSLSEVEDDGDTKG